MRFTNYPDWCDDCCWEVAGKGGYTQVHRHPCNCTCHHPGRALAALRSPSAETSTGGESPVEWATP